MRRSAPVLLLLAAAPALSGCIAAAAPVLAGSMIARVTVLKDKPAAGDGATTMAGTARSTQQAPPTPSVAPVPADLTTAVPGRLYAGALPAPVTDVASLPPGDATAAPSVARDDHGWPALVRFVARTRAAPGHSALLTHGGVLANPRWVGCDGKPPAVLAPVSIVLGGGGKPGAIAERDLGWIVALPLMGTALVLVADGPAEAAAVRAAFARADIVRPVAGDTLVTVTSEAALPAARASVGARYCVVAVAGRRAADFPHALLPTTTPAVLAEQWNAGWFWFGPAGG